MHDSQFMGVVAVEIFLGLVACSAESVERHQAMNGPRLLTFETDRAGEVPEGWSFGRTGSGPVGRWVIQIEQDAPSGSNVLAQVSADQTDYRFPLAVINEPILRDVRLSVKCKPVSGEVDRACGLVIRYQDDANYYVARANALEGNVNLYRVVDGKRRQCAGWDGPVMTGRWHELLIEARGDHFQVGWDGQRVIDTHDQTLSEPGKAGLWTKADSVTYFDDLHIEPLGGSP